MARTARQRLRSDLVRVGHRGFGVRDFTLAAADVLGRTVPFDGVCLLTLDPATLLPTGEVVQNGLPPEATARMSEIEFSGNDVNSFASLATGKQPAALLSRATADHLDRSRRHREVRRPHGFGDELRAVLTADGTPWAALTLLRTADRRYFTAADARVVASVAGEFAEGLRRALLLGSRRRRGGDHRNASGLVHIAADNTVLSADACAQSWLDELRADGGGRRLPQPLGAIAAHARRIADPSTEPDGPARARVCTPSGHWLLARGWALPEEPPDGSTVAVILEPAPTHELAPLIAAAYGLTNRERTITELIARGLSTASIADRLHLSPWTVQDHLKSIFDKTGTSNRGELVKEIFFQHYAPHLSDYPVETDERTDPA